MAERPILRLPEATAVAPKAGPTNRDKVDRPNKTRQRERLGPKFNRLEAVAANPNELLALRADPASIAPERAIVFEVEGSLDDFFAQARAIGMDYLGDFEDDFEPSEDFRHSGHPDRLIGGRVYLAMPDVRALQELLSRWRNYKELGRMPRGQGDWGALFRRLIDVRPWGAKDRLGQETEVAFAEQLQSDPQRSFLVEVELWFFDQDGKRQEAQSRVTQIVLGVGGRVVHSAVVPQIRYHALLVELAASEVKRLLDSPDVELAVADDVMFLRAQSVVQDLSEVEEAGGDRALESAANLDGAVPIAALLDGLPIQNHNRLANRLVVDDPDDLDAAYLVRNRHHGTQMASLICHGDLNVPSTPLTRPLHIRPILQPDETGRERSRKDRLLVDTVYSAVRRMKVGETGQGAVAPSVILINFSVGDLARPFARTMSPLARLLDYLSHEYNVLFLVSAGNVMTPLAIPGFQTMTEFEAASAEDREKAVLSALNAQKAVRGLLSPAEAMNVLTIGAAHRGSAFDGSLPANQFDPFTTEDGPNVCSAMGLGFRKIIKPDLLFDGGRAPVTMQSSGDQLVLRPLKSGAQRFGLKAASANSIGGTAYEDFTFGTSAATALATRAAHFIHDSLMDEEGGSHHADMPARFAPLAVKALLVHSAKWGPKGEMLDSHFPPQGSGKHVERRDDIARLLGYGVTDVGKVLDCAENRATMLGYGTIRPGHGLLYRVPLPDDLEGVTAFRSFTATLAWFSPVNTRHQGYRMAALDLSPGNEDAKYWLVSERYPYQPTDKSVARGTLFHETRTSEEARVFVDDGYLLLRISCRAPAGILDQEVPFALALSLEVGIAAGIQVYEKILVGLGAQVRAGLPVR